MPAIVDKEAKRKEIIRAAADVFSKTGYHASKMQDIAIVADIGKATIYEYFNTKEQLFLGVYDEWMSEYEAVVRQRVGEAEDPISKVDAIRDSAVEYYQTRGEQAPLLLEFWAHALRTDNPAFLERINTTRSFLQTLGADLARQLVDAGWFTEVDADAFAQLETGISDGIFLGWILEGRGYPLEKAYTFLQSLIGLGLLTDEARGALSKKLSEKLKRGF